jgi:hypothetical protein
MVIAALATTVAMLAGPSPETLYGAPFVTSLVAATPAPTAGLDGGWLRANYLAWTIEHRRYGEIERAAATIGADSPYAPWVPAAIGLAVEQLDTTAAAYVAMDRCRDLHRFMWRVAREWPAGRAAMQPVSCDIGFMCGNAKREGIRAAGSALAYHQLRTMRRLERYAETAVEITVASAAGDHAGALASCAAIGDDGPMMPLCLAEACRAKELAIVELLAPAADAEALRTCDEAGVWFVDGAAYAANREHPVELVRVHPDAPSAATARAPW